MATSITLGENLKSGIQYLGKVKNRLAHWIMHIAIRDHAAREEAKKSFKQEALVSWKTYQETGRHLTGQEACDWLNTWGTDKESENPECHE